MASAEFFKKIRRLYSPHSDIEKGRGKEVSVTRPFRTSSLALIALVLVLFAISGAGTQPASAQGSLTATIAVPLPMSLGLNPSSGDVYVGSFTSGVSVLSGTNVSVSFPASQTGYSPRSFAYDSSDGMEYVAAGNALTAIAGTNGTQSVSQGGSSPQAVSYDPSSGNLVVAGLGQLLVLSKSNAVLENFSVMPRPGGFAFDSLDNYTYSTYLIQNSTGTDTGTAVYIISGSSLIGNITLGNQEGGFVPPVYDACHNYVYEANSDLSSVSVIWGDKVLGTVPVQSGPAALAYDPANGFVYVADSGAGTVSVISGNQSIGTIPVGSSPTALAYDAYDGNVYVADSGSNAVTVINGTGVAATIPVGTDPVAIVFDSSNNDLYVANNGSGTVSVLSSVGAALSGSSTSGPSGCSPIPAGGHATKSTSTSTSSRSTRTTTSSASNSASTTSASSASSASSGSSGGNSSGMSGAAPPSNSTTTTTGQGQSGPASSSTAQTSSHPSTLPIPGPIQTQATDLLLPAVAIVVGIIAVIWLAISTIRRNRLRGI
jgi:YVTN family beta-propeller protein